MRLKLCEAAELGVNSQRLGISSDRFTQQSSLIQLKKRRSLKAHISEFGEFEAKLKDQVFLYEMRKFSYI